MTAGNLHDECLTWYKQNPSSFFKAENRDHYFFNIPAMSLRGLREYLSVLEVSYLLFMEWFSKRKCEWYFIGSECPLFVVRECCSASGLSPCSIDHKIEIPTVTSKRWNESESDSFSNQLETQPLLSFTLDWIKVKRFYCCSTENDYSKDG